MPIDRVIHVSTADLMVLGSCKPRNLRERIFGSTADQVVRGSKCPIVVVKRAAVEPYRHVIGAIDFSLISCAAAQAAENIAPKAVLELIHVLKIPLAFEQAMLKAGIAQVETDRYHEAGARAAYMELRSAKATLSLPAKIGAVRGDPATALV